MMISLPFGPSFTLDEPANRLLQAFDTSFNLIPSTDSIPTVTVVAFFLDRMILWIKTLVCDLNNVFALAPLHLVLPPT